jgi:hypothetical protein
VRSHAKASTAGSTKRRASGLGRRSVLAAALSVFSALLLFAAPAFAGTATDRPLLFSFDGSDTTAGAFTGLTRLGIDQETGSVYVMDSGNDVIDKFNPDGTAANFSGIGASSLSGSATPEGAFSLNGDADISVDNSGGANQGRFYVNRDGGPVSAFDPAGAYLWQLESSLFGEDCGSAVDSEGHLWVGDFGHGGKGVEFANTGAPPAEIGEVDDTTGNPCRLNVDASGNIFFNQWQQKVDKYVGGTFASTLDSASTSDIAIDQSSASGHLFTIHNGDFNEYESSGTKVGTFGTNLISNGQGVAYNKALDRVYVSDRGSSTVKVFGPSVTGTVPDVTIEATSAIGVSKATFNGKVNPQSVPNSYFFEWKVGTGASWAGAKSTATQSIEPTDSAEHAVSFNATGLPGNTTLQVRLVGKNTENDLRAVSTPDTFTTATAAAAPAVTVAAPSGLTATTANVSGTVNPQEDFGTNWRLQLSTDPTCASGFANQLPHNLESEASSPVAVAEELTGLLPNQDYCVRIAATNSFGTTVSEAKEFTAEQIPPTQAFTAFAAPRTDTTARLNGRVNPEGATLAHPLSYSFEYSEDGGSTWISLPDQQYSGGAREQIVLGEELTELSPGTTYQYRFLAENEAGPAVPQGQVKSFTTRSTAEMNPPQRGYELVNSPDKGNQNANFEVNVSLGAQHQPSPMSADGEKVIWSVFGGAPGGNTATGATFLAERSPSGWHSRSLIPPADQQPGNAEKGGVLLSGFTPDMSKFIFTFGRTALEPGKTVARVDSNQNLAVLHEYPQSLAAGEDADLSDNGEHFVRLNEDTPRQLEDIGSGTPELVSVMPDGLPNSCGLRPETLSFPSRAQYRPNYHMMSALDASRVYFAAIPNGEECSGFGDLAIYERNRETEETFLIDPGTVGSREPEFIRATPDGRSGFFVTFSSLDPADTNSHVDVYRWDEEAGQSTCLTCVVPDANLSPAPHVGQGLGTVLVSNDFSHIYFESESVLVPGQGKAGDFNLYVLSNGTIRFVADPNIQNGFLSSPTTELSSDGNVLMFASDAGNQAHRELTADKLLSECPSLERLGEADPHPCRELFRYDDRDGSLECISCRPDGVTRDSFGAPGTGDRGDVKLSGDGETVVFVTRETLLPEDINRNTDIYEWRRGVLRLITDGVTTFQKGSSPPQARGMSTDGRDVLFSVVAPGLTGFEQDGLVNFYDARIGGGFEVPSPSIHCSGDSCQGPLQAVPTAPKPNSSGFSGRGNLAGGRSRCRKGKVRRQGRCVKRRKHHRGHGGRAAHANRGGVK